MQCTYKIFGYISEDESFDSTYYEQQKRRRYSISFLSDSGFIDLEDHEYIKKCKHQETMHAIAFTDLPLGVNEENREKYLATLKLWTRLTYAIIFAIRRKVAYDKEIRSSTLKDRVSVMKNGDESDDEDSESYINNTFDVNSEMSIQKGPMQQYSKKQSNFANARSKVSVNDADPKLQKNILEKKGTAEPELQL